MTTKTERSTTKRAPKTSSTRQVTEDEVRIRAFEIYLARGPGSGDAVSDWLKAERELKSLIVHS